MSQLFASGGQSIGASVSAPVLLVNIQGRFSSGLTGGISLQSKGLSRVISSTIVQRAYAGVQLQQPGIQPEEVSSVSDDDVTSDS